MESVRPSAPSFNTKSVRLILTMFCIWSLHENLSETGFYAYHLSLTHVWVLTTQCVYSWIKTSSSGASAVRSTRPRGDLSQMATILNVSSIFWSLDYEKFKSSPCTGHDGSESIDFKKLICPRLGRVALSI